MKRKIIHFKIDEKETNPNRLGEWMKYLKERLPKSYFIITSPYDPSVSEDGQSFYNFDMAQLTKEDLIDLLGDNKK